MQDAETLHQAQLMTPSSSFSCIVDIVVDFPDILPFCNFYFSGSHLSTSIHQPDTG